MPAQNLHNEPELLQRVAEGDEKAFRKLFERYQSYINALAIRMTGSEAMAEDILQDTFLKVWINRETLPGKDNFGGWLYRLSINIILNALVKLKHQKKYNQYFQREEATLYILPGQADEQKELEMILQEAVDQLPPKQKQAYTLVKIKRMTHKEAASELQVHSETIKSNLDHALRFIRAYCLKQLEKRENMLLILFFLNFL